MTAGGYGYGYVRATDQDRERVRTVLADAHASGRLSWSDFDARTNALMNAQTHDQLTALTADLPGAQPYGGGYGGGYQVAGNYAPTNSLAVASLVCGLVQFLGFWVLTGIPAII